MLLLSEVNFTHISPHSPICMSFTLSQVLPNQISLSSDDFLLCRASGWHSVQCKYPLTCDSRLLIFFCPALEATGEKNFPLHPPSSTEDWLDFLLSEYTLWWSGNSPSEFRQTRAALDESRSIHLSNNSSISSSEVGQGWKRCAAANCAGSNDVVLYEKDAQRPSAM